MILVCTVQQIANGSFVPNQPTLNTDESVTYSCDAGFELSGQAQVTCLIGGNFSPGIPTCLLGEAKFFNTITNKMKVFSFIAFIVELFLPNHYLTYCFAITVGYSILLLENYYYFPKT